MSDARQRFFAFMSNINPLTIVFLMCVGFSILTYLVPGGEFERQAVMVMGRERLIVVPGSFHPVPASPQGFLQLWTVFMRGAVEGAERSFVILLSAGAMTAIIATGAINAGIHALIRKTGRLGLGFIPIMVFAIGLCSATFGMYEEGMPFVLVMAPLMLAMGFDSMVAVFILYWSIAVGFACGITNPYNVAIGQAIAGVPLYSGAWFRVICFVVFMTVTSLAIMRYAARIRKDPARSLSFAEDVANRERLKTDSTAAEDYRMTPRRALALGLVVVAFAILMYGLHGPRLGVPRDRVALLLDGDRDPDGRRPVGGRHDREEHRGDEERRDRGRDDERRPDPLLHPQRLPDPGHDPELLRRVPGGGARSSSSPT